MYNIMETVNRIYNVERVINTFAVVAIVIVVVVLVIIVVALVVLAVVILVATARAARAARGGAPRLLGDLLSPLGLSARRAAPQRPVAGAAAPHARAPLRRRRRPQRACHGAARGTGRRARVPPPLAWRPRRPRSSLST